MRNKKRDAVVLFVVCILLILICMKDYNAKAMVMPIICGFIGGIIGTIAYILFRNRQ